MASSKIGGDYDRRRSNSSSASIDSAEDRRRRRRKNDDSQLEARERPERRERYTSDEKWDRRHTWRRSASPVSETQRSGLGQRSRLGSRSRERDEDETLRIRRAEQPSSHQRQRARGPLPSQAVSFQSTHEPSSALVAADDAPVKEKPNYAPTGVLAAASNAVSQADGTSIVLKYQEPSEARKPSPRDDWKLFVFKGADILETIDLNRRSCWLIGREAAVVDLLAEHPSISKQHAVIQFRYIEKQNEYGDRLGKVKPYLIDLESANHSLLNKEEVPPSRYLELREKDMIQFGHSTREYVLMLPARD